MSEARSKRTQSPSVCGWFVKSILKQWFLHAKKYYRLWIKKLVHSLITITVKKKNNTDQNQLVEESIYLDCRQQFITEGSRSRNSRQELEAVTTTETMRKHCWLSHLTGVAAPTVGWALDINRYSRKWHHRLVYRSIWWRQFLSWDFLFPGDLSLGQVGKNT